MFGKYEIIETLGQGGMGTVYKARDPKLDRVVALKVLNPDIASPENYERFRREVRVLTKLRHPNIIRFLTAGVEQDRVYFTTEYVEGQPLTDLIAGVRTAQGREALIRVLATVARAVHHAHEQGIIHRDLKPSNIIVEKGVGDLSDRVPDPLFHGNPIITDFGLARELGSGHTITTPGAAVGTALYMSPEQAEGDAARIGPAADIYALGSILYEILTGRPPFEGETAAAILGRKVRQRPPSPRESDPSISRDLEAICLKSLARSDRARYPTAEGLAIDLERALAGEPIFASRPLIQRLPRFVQARPTHWAVIAATAVLLIAAAVVYGYSRLGREPSGWQEIRASGGVDVSAGTSQPANALAQLEARITSYRPSASGILCIAASDTDAWWGSRAGAVRHEIATGANWFYPIPGGAHVITHAGKGNWWFGTYGNGACLYDGTRWTTYTKEDGLAGNRVYAIAVDARGNTWFATDGGLSGFDGKAWVSHTVKDGLPAAHVRAVAIDGLGHTWVACYLNDSYSTSTSGCGVSCFDGRSWTTYTTKDGLPDNRVRFIAPDVRGRVWVGSRSGGVSRFDGSTWTTYTEKKGLPDRVVHALTTDSQGRAWVGTGSNSYRGYKTEWRGGVTRIGDDKCTTYTNRDGLPRGEVRAIGTSTTGRTWVGTPNGVACHDGKTWTTYTDKDGLAHNAASAIAIDPRGRPWVVTSDPLRNWGYVSTFDGTGWTTHTTKSGLTHHSVRSLAVDRRGSVWVGTSYGLSRFDGEVWTSYTRADGLPGDRVTSLAVDRRDRVWVASIWPVASEVSRVGVSCFDGNTWTTYTKEDGLAGRQVWSIAFDARDRTWAATSHGISCFDGSRWTTYKKEDGLADSEARMVASDAQGHTWAGTWMGVARFDGRKWTVYRRGGKMTGGKTLAIDGRGRPWFGTKWGVARFDGRRWTRYLRDKEIRRLGFDAEGRTWIGTTKGEVGCFDGADWTFYGEKDGLKGDRISVLVADPKGRMWVGAPPGGLSCFDGTSWRTWTTKDGLASDTVTALAFGHDGSIWVGTSSGLSHMVLKRTSGTPVGE